MISILLISFQILSSLFDLLFYKIGLRSFKNRVLLFTKNNKYLFWTLELFITSLFCIPINLVLYFSLDNKFYYFYNIKFENIRYFLLLILIFVVCFSIYNSIKRKYKFIESNYKFERLRLLNVYFGVFTVNYISSFLKVNYLINLAIWGSLFIIYFFATNLCRVSLQETIMLTLLNSIFIIIIASLNFSILEIIIVFTSSIIIRNIYIKKINRIYGKEKYND